MLNPIEATPPSYHRLMELIGRINQRFIVAIIPSRAVRQIANPINYWQFVPLDIEEAINQYAIEKIPERSPIFNRLFFQQCAMTRNFIVDEIFGNYLRVKRKGDDFKMCRDAPIDVEDELEEWDKGVTFRLSQIPDKERGVGVLTELKEEVEKWFSGEAVQAIDAKFMEVIPATLKTKLTSE
jgi:hypothetical protein